MDFYSQIEELLSTESDNLKIAKLIKKEINRYNDSLVDVFEKRQGKDFLVNHTKSIDRYINLIYKCVLRQFFGNYVPMQNSLPLTLVAMGSYGREELCLYSDIDLMFVYKETKGYNILPLIEAMLYLAWDSGLKIGHRVHEVQDLFKASKEDETIKTAMLESRFICGSKYLWMESGAEFNKIRKYNIRKFIQDKLQAHELRKDKFPFDMQPNVKEGTGGLRDVNTLFWIANVLYNVTKLIELVPKYISENEFKEYRSAIEFIFRVRLALHLEAGKKQDALVLEYIPSVASRLGFVDKKTQSAQSILAKQTLKSLWVIKVNSQIFISRILAPMFYDAKNISILRKSYIGNGFYLHEKTLYVSFRKKPLNLHELLKFLYALPDEEINFDIRVINFAKKTIVPTNNGKKTYELFAKFFYKKYLNQHLYMLYKAGILQAIVKPLKHILHLPQFDGYHRYPVDIHSVKSVLHLENIKDSHVKEVYESLNSEEKSLLKLVTFFHDIGKGRGGDHSIVGAKIFKVYATKLSLKEEFIILGDRLIKHHILMSNIASREDIYSENVIYSFLAAIKTVQCLKLLYVLTYADISAVGKDTYTSFNSRLTKELYNISLNAFDKNNLLDEASRRRRREKAILNNPNFSQFDKRQRKKILNIPSNLFFIKHTSTQIINIASWAFDTEKLFIDINVEQNLTLTIIRNSNINIAYILEKLAYLDVQEMEIFDLFDNLKYFKINFKDNIHKDDIPLVENLVKDSFEMQNKEPLYKPLMKKEDFTLDCDHSQTYALIGLKTKDQQGLLAYVMYIFDKFNLKISGAKIQTIKNRTRNLFLIEKQGILCQNKEKIMNLLYTFTKDKGK